MRLGARSITDRSKSAFAIGVLQQKRRLASWFQVSTRHRLDASSILLLITELLFTRSSSGAPGECPNLRPGSWEFTRTIRSAHTCGKPQMVKATRCLDPATDMKQ